MAKSLFAVIREAVGIWIIGEMAALIILLSFGGSDRPVAVNCATLLRTLIWFVSIQLANRRDSLYMWTWGKSSYIANIAAIIMMIAFVVGRGDRMKVVLPNISTVFRPLESQRLAWCMVSPLGEEMLWRGFLLRRLEPIIGTWQAIAVSSVAFGVIHPNILGATALGAVLGWMYSPLGARNIYVSMFFHVLINLLSNEPFLE